MKKLILVVLLSVLLFPGLAKADDYVEPGTFTWGLGVGGALSGTGFGSAYNGGYGLEGNLGFILNKNMALLLAIDSFIFDSNVTGYYVGEVNFLPSFRYTFSGSAFKPYLIGGLGLNTGLFYYPVSYGTTYTGVDSLAMGLGAGVALSVNDHMDIYFQVKYDEAFASGGAISYLPLSLGVQFDQM